MLIGCYKTNVFSSNSRAPTVDDFVKILHCFLWAIVLIILLHDSIIQGCIDFWQLIRVRKFVLVYHFPVYRRVCIISASSIYNARRNLAWKKQLHSPYRTERWSLICDWSSDVHSLVHHKSHRNHTLFSIRWYIYIL